MKFLLILYVALNIIVAIKCYSIDEPALNRAKRSDDDGFFSKVKSGITDFGSKTKKFFVKGYEETKNLFSSERNVGDYTLGDIDVRFDGDDEEADNSTTVATRKKRETPVIIDGFKESDNEEDNASTNMNSDTEPDSDGQIIILPPMLCKEGQVLVKGRCRVLIH
ncbi:unnamed protein product [Chironomus riparius]|uniref:Uncharacterized protein n=1 Tax=Chironomus riparius TaxID=315576 RepID=A0A9N9RTS5_9DIPT|nr:unnamed protein product [Chironomus riparius]